MTVGLTGCSLPGSSDCSRPAVSDADVMELIDVTGDVGDQPEVDVYTPFHAPHLAFEDVVTGDGTADHRAEPAHGRRRHAVQR